jgi:hypothetical protein
MGEEIQRETERAAYLEIRICVMCVCVSLVLSVFARPEEGETLQKIEARRELKLDKGMTGRDADGGGDGDGDGDGDGGALMFLFLFFTLASL